MLMSSQGTLDFSSGGWLLTESDSERWVVRQNDENMQSHWVQMFMMQVIYCLYFLLSTFETVSDSWSLESCIYHYKHSRVNLPITRKEIQQMNVLAGCLMKKALAEILVYTTSFLQLHSTCWSPCSENIQHTFCWNQFWKPGSSIWLQEWKIFKWRSHWLA